jgi:hypothetical protein
MTGATGNGMDRMIGESLIISSEWLCLSCRAGRRHRKYGLYGYGCTGTVYRTVWLEREIFTVRVTDYGQTVYHPSSYGRYGRRTVFLGFTLCSWPPITGCPQNLRLSPAIGRSPSTCPHCHRLATPSLNLPSGTCL